MVIIFDGVFAVVSVLPVAAFAVFVVLLDRPVVIEVVVVGGLCIALVSVAFIRDAIVVLVEVIIVVSVVSTGVVFLD